MKLRQAANDVMLRINDVGCAQWFALCANVPTREARPLCTPDASRLPPRIPEGAVFVNLR